MPNPEVKTILCPVDFGDLSAYALRYAKELAQEVNEKLRRAIDRLPA